MVAIQAQINPNHVIRPQNNDKSILRAAPVSLQSPVELLGSASQAALKPLPQGRAETQVSLNSDDSPSLADIRAGAVLKADATGPAVTALQEMLTRAGYGVQATGTLGPTTVSQLKRFQRDSGIEATGELGPTTLKALENPLQTTAAGRRLATAGRKAALALGGYSSLGLCYTGVANALAQVGVKVTGLSAYMAANQLARSPKFREVKLAASELGKLPAGAVVVWERSSNPRDWAKGAGFAHGHIAIADGNGNEMSDYIDTQRTSYYASNRFRVFLPR
ncbi:MAG: peptidoglycan-binding domain-containing protein [Candidatus Sericytochromatia bacterium]